MELSLSHSFSAARALFQNSPSSPQTTTTTTTTKTVRLAGPFTCMSSRCSRILPPSTTKLYGQRRSISAKLFIYQQNKSYSKVAPDQSYGRKSTVVPFVRAATQFEEDKSADTSPLEKILQFGNVLVQFVRPYAAVGTVIGFSGLAARTWMENPHMLKLSWSLIMKTLAVALALVTLDGFVCGINQIFDLDIDKVNKPYLPIASGELSLGFAWLLVMGFVATGLSIAAALKSVPFLGLLAFEYLMGYIYSAPPLRTKKSTFGAILTIAWMRGYVFPMLLNSAARATLGLPFQLSIPVAFITIFSTLFCLAIGIMKDTPDYEGDKKYNVPTLATIFGVRRIAYLGFGILLLTYVGAISASLYMPQAFKPSVMIPAHILLALSLVFQAWKLEKANYRKEEAQSFYLFMWKLLDAEHLVLPFI